MCMYLYMCIRACVCAYVRTCMHAGVYMHVRLSHSGIMVSRGEPDDSELEDTARGICKSDRRVMVSSLVL